MSLVFCTKAEHCYAKIHSPKYLGKFCIRCCNPKCTTDNNDVWYCNYSITEGSKFFNSYTKQCTDCKYRFKCWTE
jgi:hypothetical protein